jgi:regulator of sirC expression with transglutaminase-like and TPR domain
MAVESKTSEKKQLSEDELKAFVNLLSDSEERTLNLMADQLINFEDSSLKRIQELTDSRDDLQLTGNWYHTSKIHLSKQIKNWKQEGDLETGLFLLARFENPGLDVDYYKSVLDSYTQRVEDNLTISSTEDEIIKSINQVLFKEEGFVGNQIDYYDINNNFINTVLEFKTGNPIMISAVYILIARRLGLDIEGVGTPGHFIVKFRDRFYDPFFSGREITKDECVLRAQELSVFWRDEYLDSINDVFIIARCIRNLIAIYKKKDELDKAAEISGLLKLV